MPDLTRPRTALRRLLDRLAGASPPRTPPREEAARAPLRPESPSTSAGDPTRRTYLEFVAGTSAKFYALVLSVQPEGTWSVAFNFGRIGHPRDWALKIADASQAKAEQTYASVLREKLGEGYQERPWPADLEPPGSAIGSARSAPRSGPAPAAGIYHSLVAASLPPPSSAVVADIALPSGRHLSIEASDDARSGQPVLWVSEAVVPNVDRTWSALAESFVSTGLWPVIVEAETVDDLPERLLAYPPGEPSDLKGLLRTWWRQSIDPDDDDPEIMAPLGKRFPGLASPTPGERPTTISHLVVGMTGNLALVPVVRPADVLGAISWAGPANYDLHPADQSTLLQSWEERFDAYLVGLGADTLSLAVARPPRDTSSAARIAAEHFAFCPDNIWQGAGSISEYADGLVGATRWDFWWD